MKWDAPLKMTRGEPLWVLRETNHGASLKSLQKSTQKSLWVWVQILMSLCPLQELAVWTGKAKPLVLLLFRFTSLLSTTSSKRHHFINYALFPGSSSNDKPFSLFMFAFLPNSLLQSSSHTLRTSIQYEGTLKNSWVSMLQTAKSQLLYYQFNSFFLCLRKQREMAHVCGHITPMCETCFGLLRCVVQPYHWWPLGEWNERGKIFLLLFLCHFAFEINKPLKS